VAWTNPFVLVHSTPALLGSPAGSDDTEALACVVAATVDLVLAQQHFTGKEAAGQEDAFDDGEDDDDDDDEHDVELNFGGKTGSSGSSRRSSRSSSHAVTTARLATVVRGVERILAEQRLKGPRPPPPAGSPLAASPLDLGVANRGALLELALELGALSGQQCFDKGRLLLGSTARALHTKHFSTSFRYAELQAALLPSAIAQSMLEQSASPPQPPLSLQSEGGGGGNTTSSSSNSSSLLLGPELLEAIRTMPSDSSSDRNGGSNSGGNNGGELPAADDEELWETFDGSRVLRWVSSDLPDLRTGGGVGSGTTPILAGEHIASSSSATGGASSNNAPSAAVAVGGGVGVVSASGVEDMLSSLESALAGVEPLVSSGAELEDLCPPSWLAGVKGGKQARRKEARLRFTELLVPLADPFAAPSEE
jgi:hypothetical protein